MDEGKVYYTTGLAALCDAADFVEDTERNYHPDVDHRNFHHGYARSGSPGNSDESNGTDSRERRRNGGREIHNQLEKTRRAQLKDHFLALKKVVPSLSQKKHSNQAILKLSQKYIQSLIAKERKFQLDIQELSKKRAHLTETLRKKSEEFEQIHGFSVKVVLEQSHQEDVVEEVSSISTKSADEVANMKDFDDEEEGASAPQPSPPVLNATRGIPHPVIRETPLLSQRPMPVPALPPAAAPLTTINQTIPQATVKKLQAKLTTTRLIPCSQARKLPLPPTCRPKPRPAPHSLLSQVVQCPPQQQQQQQQHQQQQHQQQQQQQQQQQATFASVPRHMAGGFMVSMGNPPGGAATLAANTTRLRFGTHFPLAPGQAMVNTAGQLIATGAPVNIAPGTPVNLTQGTAMNLAPGTAMNLAQGTAMNLAPGTALNLNPGTPMNLNPGTPMGLPPGTAMNLAAHGTPMNHLTAGTPMTLTTQGPLGGGGQGQVSTPAMITVQSSSNGQYLVRVPPVHGQPPVVYFNGLFPSPQATTTPITTTTVTSNNVASSKSPLAAAASALAVPTTRTTAIITNS